jgi:hypothetical protein
MEESVSGDDGRMKSLTWLLGKAVEKSNKRNHREKGSHLSFFRSTFWINTYLQHRQS